MNLKVCAINCIVVLTVSALVVGPGKGKPPIFTKASVLVMAVAMMPAKRRQHNDKFFIVSF